MGAPTSTASGMDVLAPSLKSDTIPLLRHHPLQVDLEHQREGQPPQGQAGGAPDLRPESDRPAVRSSTGRETRDASGDCPRPESREGTRSPRPRRARFRTPRRSSQRQRGIPMIPAVMSSMLGSVTGEETQKAITGASGSPRRRSTAMSGSTPRPHTGVMAPTKLANDHRAGRAAGEPGERAVRPVAQRQGAGEQRGDDDYRQQCEQALGHRDEHPGTGLGPQRARDEQARGDEPRQCFGTRASKSEGPDCGEFHGDSVIRRTSIAQHSKPASDVAKDRVTE